MYVGKKAVWLNQCVVIPCAQPPQVQTIADAQSALAVLDAFDKEQQAVTSAVVSSLKALGADILARKYETTHSQYVYESPSDISAHESDVDGELTRLTTLSAAKRSTLDADLKRELEKEELRLEFSNRAYDFAQYVDDTCLIISPFVSSASQSPC